MRDANEKEIKALKAAHSLLRKDRKNPPTEEALQAFKRDCLSHLIPEEVKKDMDDRSPKARINGDFTVVMDNPTENHEESSVDSVEEYLN